MGMKQTNKQTNRKITFTFSGWHLYTRECVCVCPNAFGKRTPEC